MVRGAACNYWAQGVDGLYLAHWFGNWPYQASFYEKLRELPYPEVMAARDKIYYVPTMTGRYPDPIDRAGDDHAATGLFAKGQQSFHHAVGQRRSAALGQGWPRFTKCCCGCG